jgi:hypothetical protein
MPGPAAAAEVGDRVGARLDKWHLFTVVALIAGAFILWTAAARASAGGGIKVAAKISEDVPPFVPPPGAPVVGPDQHIGGTVYTPHRYPHMCGGEISAVIHHGHATMVLPHEKDMTWLVRPPSEASL